MATQMHKRALSQAMTNGTPSPSNGGFPTAPGAPGIPGKKNDAKLYCKNCKTDRPNIVEETANGDLVCADCGLVLGDRVVDTRSEWRTFANDEGPDQSRVGDGPTQQQEIEGGEDYSTTVDFRDGQTGTSKNLQRTARMQLGSNFIHRRDAGFGKIEDFCSAMNIESSRIKLMAKQIYHHLEQMKQKDKKNKFGKGKNTENAVAAACIHIASRENNATRSMKETCDICHIKKKDLGYSMKLISEEFKGDFQTGFSKGILGPGTSASDGAKNLLPRLCPVLGVVPPYEGRVRDVLDVAFAKESSMVDGRSPISVAAGAIWFIIMLFGLNATLREVSQHTQVSDGTIKLVFRILCRHRSQLVPNQWVAAGADLSKISVPDVVKKETR